MTTATDSSRTLWRFFPHALTGGLLMVVAVDGVFIWWAAATFPGAVDSHAFDHGNHYDAILAAADRQAASGWRVDVGAEDRMVTLQARDREGKPLTGLVVTASAERRLGDTSLVPLSFIDMGGGRYVAHEKLPASGPWQVSLVVSGGAEPFRQASRLDLP